MHVVVHAIALGQWRLVLSDLLLSLEHHGVYSIAESVTVCATGDDEQIAAIRGALSSFGDTRFRKVNVLHTGNNTIKTWEFRTINYMRDMAFAMVAQGKDAHFLYLHTKGLYEIKGDFVAKWFWRKWMEEHVVEHHDEARALLQWGYDAVGCNAINVYLPPHEEMKVNENHAWHYSGNFWWATAKHLASLSPLKADHNIGDPERCKAENFVLSKLPNMCAGVLGRSNYSHIYHTREIPTLKARPGARLIVFNPERSQTRDMRIFSPSS